MTRIHVVSDCQPTNGMFVAASLIAARENAQVVSAKDFITLASLSGIDEVVVHGCWLPCYWKSCLKVLRDRAAIGKPRLARMTHGSMSPVYLQRQGKWRKRLVAPIERWLFAKCDRILVTGRWEQSWCEQWGVRGPFDIVDLKQYFSFPPPPSEPVSQSRTIHLLYLGRPHPLKGVAVLQQAVADMGNVELRIVSNHTGEELERDWAWCDILCLPTLSDNFGLVVAEALSRGKRAITTDGAPAWENQPGVTYLNGYRDSPHAHRVEQLASAIRSIALKC